MKEQSFACNQIRFRASFAAGRVDPYSSTGKIVMYLLNAGPGAVDSESIGNGEPLLKGSAFMPTLDRLRHLKEN